MISLIRRDFFNKLIMFMNQYKYMESQKTCKLFGAIRAILGIKNALPLIHGPIGCAYHIRYILSARSARQIRVLSTEMDQNDVVFGAEEKLESKIRDVDERYSPELIAVLTSCASSIIGEDMEGVIKRVKNHINAEIIWISSGGFEGNQTDGYEESLSALINLMEEPKIRKGHIKDSINLVAQFRGGPDLKNLKKDFKKLKININCVLTSGATLNEIKNAGAADLNVSMCEASGIVPCEIMQKKFGTPFLSETVPIGVSATSNYFKTICEFLSLEYTLKEDEENAKRIIREYSDYTAGKKAVIISGSTRAIALTEFLQELGVEPVLICLDFEGRDTINKLVEVTSKGNSVPVILKEPEYYEILEHTEKLDPDIILGGLGEIGISKTFDIPLVDVMHSQEITMGFEGALKLAEIIKKALTC